MPKGLDGVTERVVREGWAPHPANDGRARLYVGHRVRWARERAGLSQGELAERVGVSRPTVVGWEKGERCPDVGRFYEVARACGVWPGEIYREQYPGAPLDPAERREWFKLRVRVVV